MASTFTLYSQPYDGRYLRLECTQVQKQDENRSLIYWTLYTEGGKAAYYSTGATTVIIDTKQAYYKARVNLPDTEFPAKIGETSGVVSVDHDSNGIKEVEISITTAIHTTESQVVSGRWTLDQIPQGASILTVSNFYDGDNPYITFSNPYGNGVDQLKAGISLTLSIQGDIERVVSDKNSNKYTFSLTSEERELLRNSCASTNSKKLLFYIKTKIGNQTLTSTMYGMFYVNDALPIVNGSVGISNDTSATYDVAELTGNNSTVIKGFCNAYVTMTATAQKGASIDQDLYVIRNGDNVIYGTSGDFLNLESGEFNFSAQDSRGNVGHHQIILPVVEYFTPSCSMGVTTISGSGTATVTCSGNFFNDTFGAVTNTLNCSFRYKEFGGSYGSWQSMTVTKNGNYYYASADATGLDYKKTYVFQAKAADKITSKTARKSAINGVPVFHWGKSDFVHETPITVNGDTKVTGDLWLKGSENYGNTIYFGDKSYVTISEPEDDLLRLNASIISLNSNSLTIGESSLSDFVVEYGTLNSWHYRKWNSGVAECWITSTVSTTITSAWGSLYVGNTTSEVLSYPLTFISRPREIATLHSGTTVAWMYLRENNTTTQTGKYNIVRPTSLSTAVTCYYDIYVIGKWK